MAIQELKQQDIKAVSGGIIFGLPILGNILSYLRDTSQGPALGGEIIENPGTLLNGLLEQGPATLAGLFSAVLAILIPRF